MKFLRELTAPQPIQKPQPMPMTPSASGGVPSAQAVSTPGDARLAVAATAKPSTSTAKPAPNAPATAVPAAQPQAQGSAQATADQVVPGQNAPVVPPGTAVPAQGQMAKNAMNPQAMANTPQAQQLLGRLQELAGLIKRPGA